MKPHLSNSSLSMLFKCGLQYRFRYVEGIKTPPGVALVIGKGAHAGVEADLRSKLEWGELLSDEAVSDYAADSAHAEWQKEPPQLQDGDPDKGGAVDTAVALAKLHHQRVAPALEPIAIERGFRIEVPGFSHDLVGYIDVEEVGRIRDTKTSRKTPPEDVADKSDQLTMYSLEASARGKPVKEVVLDYLVSTSRPQSITRRSTRTEADHQRLLAKVELASKVIQAGTFLPAPADSWACSAKWCGYWQRCDFGERGRIGVRGLIDPASLISRLEVRRAA